MGKGIYLLGLTMGYLVLYAMAALMPFRFDSNAIDPVMIALAAANTICLIGLFVLALAPQPSLTLEECQTITFGLIRVMCWLAIAMFLVVIAKLITGPLIEGIEFYLMGDLFAIVMFAAMERHMRAIQKEILKEASI